MNSSLVCYYTSNHKDRKMEIRDAIHPEHAALFDTEELREQFLIEDLFIPGQFKLVYSFFDRLIVGGISPLTPLSMDID